MQKDSIHYEPGALGPMSLADLLQRSIDSARVFDFHRHFVDRLCVLVTDICWLFGKMRTSNIKQGNK